ncbi:uncharacterized protein [Dendrobates tinctorius]|uniref:uncharacterized protein n=1 Tax=Dendrobates tinctorius TaxID=92724 RepID=UPI003CC9245D
MVSESEVQEQPSQVPVVRWRVPQRDEDIILDNDTLINLVQECVPLWDSCDPQHVNTSVTRRLWNEVSAALMDGWDNACTRVRKDFLNKVRTRWRSMKDRFNRDVRDEGQVHSGSAARTRTKYRYHRELAFLRLVLATRATWRSTLQPVPGVVLHRTTSDPSQPSDSQEASCRSATQTTGDQEADTAPMQPNIANCGQKGIHAKLAEYVGAQSNTEIIVQLISMELGLQALGRECNSYIPGRRLTHNIPISYLQPIDFNSAQCTFQNKPLMAECITADLVLSFIILLMLQLCYLTEMDLNICMKEDIFVLNTSSLRNIHSNGNLRKLIAMATRAEIN